MSNDLHHDKRPSPGQRSSSPPPTLHSNISFTTHDSSSNLYPHDLAIDAARDLHMEDSPPSSGGNIRWAMLAAACLVMFGNYYAFDNPAALNKPLQDYMEMSDDTYAYFLNILYTSYSLPNIVLPWLGGFASDKFGHRRLLIFLSAMVAFGHFIVCLGVQRRSVPAMILGRVFFGAGESLAVTQSAITVKYFRGKELAMALGINLCIARLGSVLNDVLTPYIWSRSSIPEAFWGGFVSCVISFGTACILVSLDSRYESIVFPEFSRLPTHGDTRFSIDSLPPLQHARMGTATIMGRYDPILSKPRDSEDIDLEVLHHSGVQSHRDRRRTSDGSVTELGSGSGPSSLEVGSDDQYFSDDGGEEQESMVQDEKLNRMGEVSPFEHCLAFLKAAFDYSQSFWLLFLLSSLLIGVQVPFNSIHAGFLQMRWYPNDPQKAAQIMTVPDLLSAILVLPIGFFVDHYGQKSWLFMLCGLTIGFSHFVLGLIRIPTPVPVLMALGIASAIGATITSAIPILVKNHQIATAYGILSSAMNLAFTFFPLIVAKLMTMDPSIYTYSEIFFSCCGFCGFFLSVRLRCLDIHGDLDRRELDNIDK